MSKIKPEWSKAFLAKPRDNLISHVHIRDTKFIPSYDNDPCPVPMNLLIGWEYARIWLRERDLYIQKREKRFKPKVIKNDTTWWLQKRAVKAKKTC